MQNKYLLFFTQTKHDSEIFIVTIIDTPSGEASPIFSHAIANFEGLPIIHLFRNSLFLLSLDVEIFA